MEGQVSWVIDLAVKPGKLDAFTELMEEMVAGTSTEPQTLAYEWYISEEGSTVHIYEKYADSDATVKHVTGFVEKWAERFTGCVDVNRFVVYGDPSAGAREMLAGFGPEYLGPWGGFSRFA
jgi:quinol monooxygenase YgiN